MKRVAASLILFASIGAMAFGEDITGYVSESHCGVKHDSVSEANSKCIEGCLKKGSDPVLVKDGKVMTFDAASKDKAKTFAGKNVKIDGSVQDSVVTISSISKSE